jgi:lysylphosphatidylglycerol synthetase-like protein (DUF2156 family)
MEGMLSAPEPTGAAPSSSATMVEADLSDPSLRTARAYPEQALWVGVVVACVGLYLAFHGSRSQNHQLVAEGLAGAVVGRGIVLGRPLLTKHLAVAVALLVLARVSDARGHFGIEQLILVVAALAALWAAPAPPASARQRQKIAALVDNTPNDCLAPFAQRLDKSYVFSPDGQAAIAYRVRWGVAVASGDPLGAPDSHLDAATTFLNVAAAQGWRVGVLGAGEDWAQWWRQRGLRAVPIGRDVVIDVNSFHVSGRAFRNLRQAVQRTHNSGVTTRIYKESELPDDLYEHLRALVESSKRNPHRGFSMILDGLLERKHPGTLIAVAWNHDGEVVAFQRFATADKGREISQDLPWRAPGAPNGVDERLAFDTIEWAKQQGARRLSLSFAAFPGLFDSDNLGPAERAGYWAAHRLDPLIKLESLYRYLRKFHSMGRQRYAMVRVREVIPVASAMLTFEFGARRHRRSEHRRLRFLK